MIVLASNPKTMKFENPDPDLVTWINRSPDPNWFVQNVVNPAGLESWILIL